MANNENLIPIPGRLHSVATEGHVAGADEIYDDTQSKLQSAINAEVAEDISDLQEIVGEGSVDTRIENAVKALDSEKSQSAGADGLALSVTEVDGKITSISGSIATDTYDSYGSASAAQEAAATDATTKVNAAKAELLGDAATDYNTLGKLEDAIQSEASTRETEIGTDSTSGTVKGRIKSLETLVGTTDVDSQIDAKINALDSTKSQTAGADGLALSIEEEDGKIKSISGSIAANTYDAYGAASTAKSDLLGDAASDYNTLGKLEDAIQAEATTRSGETEALDGRLDGIEEVIPSAATSSNQLADKAFVNSSISTATAEYQGNYNSVSDLNLSVSATHAQIATALGTEISGADNNDYCFVQIPTADATPTEIDKVERYKYNGTAWSFEYELNNSGYTEAQWAAINSGITSNLVTAFGNKYDKPSGGIPSTDMSSAVQTSLGKADSAYQKPSGGIPGTDIADGVIPDISGKQDTIDSSHKLSADLVDDTNTTNKFTNATEKQTWNAKQDALIFNTAPSSSNKVATMADLADCAYLGDDDGSAVVPSFDPETDTLHKAAQVLTTAQKDQVAQNLNNRPATNGMGRIELKAADNFKTVVEAQTGGNTIFVIKYDFTLTGDVTIPANCILQFDGGSISGEHTITANNTKIQAEKTKIFESNVNLSGSFVCKAIYPEWFGAIKSDNIDSSAAIQTALNKASNLSLPVEFDSLYRLDNPINAYFYAIIFNNTRFLTNVKRDFALALSALSVNEGTFAEINGNVALINQNTSFEEIEQTITFPATGSIPVKTVEDINTSNIVYQDFTINGARVGDMVLVERLEGGILHYVRFSGEVIADDTVRIYINNFYHSAISLSEQSINIKILSGCCHGVNLGGTFAQNGALRCIKYTGLSFGLGSGLDQECGIRYKAAEKCHYSTMNINLFPVGGIAFRSAKRNNVNTIILSVFSAPYATTPNWPRTYCYVGLSLSGVGNVFNNLSVEGTYHDYAIVLDAASGNQLSNIYTEFVSSATYPNGYPLYCASYATGNKLSYCYGRAIQNVRVKGLRNDINIKPSFYVNQDCTSMNKAELNLLRDVNFEKSILTSGIGNYGRWYSWGANCVFSKVDGFIPFTKALRVDVTNGRLIFQQRILWNADNIPDLKDITTNLCFSFWCRTNQGIAGAMILTGTRITNGQCPGDERWHFVVCPAEYFGGYIQADIRWLVDSARTGYAEIFNPRITIGYDSIGIVDDSVLHALDNHGTTRPINVPIGHCFLDETLGKPIWHTGTGWVDATGATV